MKFDTDIKHAGALTDKDGPNDPDTDPRVVEKLFSMKFMVGGITEAELF